MLRSIPLAPEPMVRKLGLIYRKDKALSKAALGFIQAMLAHFGSQNPPRPGSDDEIADQPDPDQPAVVSHRTTATD